MGLILRFYILMMNYSEGSFYYFKLQKFQKETKKDDKSSTLG